MRYLTLAEALTIAEAVTGLDSVTLVRHRLSADLIEGRHTRPLDLSSVGATVSTATADGV